MRFALVDNILMVLFSVLEYANNDSCIGVTDCMLDDYIMA